MRHQKPLHLPGSHVDEKEPPAGGGLRIVYDGYETPVAELGPVRPQELDSFAESIAGQITLPCPAGGAEGASEAFPWTATASRRAMEIKL